ncbi:unnamed protein product [Orchesella dallaii]|uniref:Uncharacterized protein n=1 Tax=Orchesella dallaii TaxID=48710 RepID=A0ABP1Q8H5_9HEXA
MKVVNLYLMHYFLTLTTIISCYESNTDENEEEDLHVLKKGRTRRMIWLDKKRQLIFPPDTSLSITPMLAFPMFKQSSTWVAFENVQIVWTFFILFQGLGWTSDDNAWPLDISSLIPNMTTTSTMEANRRNGYCHRKNKFRNDRCGRHIPVMSLPHNTPGGDRATLFPQIERFLNSFGIDGRACLQRVVCEVHEIPLKNGFGIFGEFLTMLFSVSESIFAKSHLPGYMKAEKAGKYGDCSKFYKKCPYSIFTSK